VSGVHAALRLAVFVSGSGRTLENLLEKIAAGNLEAEVVLVVSSREDVRGTAIARRAGLPTIVLNPRHSSVEQVSAQAFAACRERGADLVVLGGYLHLLEIPADFAGRVVNIHPSLLPAFGGKGYHGLAVHRAVLARGCTVSGCTVHLVDEIYDNGRVLAQEAVQVVAGDTPDTLAARVFAAECRLLPAAIQAIAEGQHGPLPLGPR
jgi:phosphoribosylglycinamide formyltransferase-1